MKQAVKHTYTYINTYIYKYIYQTLNINQTFVDLRRTAVGKAIDVFMTLFDVESLYIQIFLCNKRICSVK